MPPVCNDPDLMRELAGALRAFRESSVEAAARVQQKLLFELSATWQDDQYAAFRDQLTSDLERLRRLIDEDTRALERFAGFLRARLDDYLDASSGEHRTTVNVVSVTSTTIVVATFRSRPFVAESFARLLDSLSGAASVVLDSLHVLAELLCPTHAARDDHPLPRSARDAAVPVLLDLLRSPDPKVRALAADLLARLGTETCGPAIEWIDSPEEELRRLAVRLLGGLMHETAEAIGALGHAISDAVDDIRIEAIDALDRFGSGEARAVLEGAVHHPHAPTRERARDALIRHESRTRCAEALRAFLETPRASAAEPATIERAIAAAELVAARPAAVGAIEAVARATSGAAMVDDFRAARAAIAEVARFSRADASSRPVPDAPLARDAKAEPSRPPLGEAASALIESMLRGSESADAQVTARNPIVRSAAASVSAVRMRDVSPARALELAGTAVAAAREANDRGLLANALTVRADGERRAGRPRESLATYAEAEDSWNAMTVAERLQWRGHPVEIHVACGRAAACAFMGNDGPGLFDVIADLLTEVFLLLLRMLRRGMKLSQSLLGLLLEWIVKELRDSLIARFLPFVL